MKKESKAKLILELYNEGLSLKDIYIKTDFKKSTISGTIRKYIKSKNTSGFFNVNEKDCWLIPTSDPSTHE